MNIINTHIPEVLILEPTIHEDERGFSYESYNQKVFSNILGADITFTQDQHSYSAQNVLRGLHYHLDPPQGKLISVPVGEVFSIAIDLRKKSPTYKQWVGTTLSSQIRRFLWIPKGFAHGFLVLSENAELICKTTDFADSERCIRWNDPELNIPWPISGQPIVSKKDSEGHSLKDAEVYS